MREAQNNTNSLPAFNTPRARLPWPAEPEATDAGPRRVIFLLPLALVQASPVLCGMVGMVAGIRRSRRSSRSRSRSPVATFRIRVRFYPIATIVLAQSLLSL
jgi:hypothetical protein